MVLLVGSGPTAEAHQRSHPVHLVGHVQHAVDDGFVVLLVIQELWSMMRFC